MIEQTELQRKAEKRLHSAVAAFITVGFLALIVGGMTDCAAIVIVGVVAFVFAALAKTCAIAVPAFSDDELKKIGIYISVGSDLFATITKSIIYGDLSKRQ